MHSKTRKYFLFIAHWWGTLWPWDPRSTANWEQCVIQNLGKIQLLQKIPVNCLNSNPKVICMISAPLGVTEGGLGIMKIIPVRYVCIDDEWIFWSHPYKPTYLPEHMYGTWHSGNTLSTSWKTLSCKFKVILGFENLLWFNRGFVCMARSLCFHWQ